MFCEDSFGISHVVQFALKHFVKGETLQVSPVTDITMTLSQLITVIKMINFCVLQVFCNFFVELCK